MSAYVHAQLGASPIGLPSPLVTGFPRLLESPGTVIVKFPGPGKSWKMRLVLEMYEVLEVLEFAAGPQAAGAGKLLNFFLQ